MRKKLDYTRTGHWRTVRTENLAGGQQDEQVDATANPSHKKAAIKVIAVNVVAVKVTAVSAGAASAGAAGAENAGAENAGAENADAMNVAAGTASRNAIVSSAHASREAAPADAMEPARNMHERPISPVRQLLDYTRSGRWALISEDLARAEKFVRAMEQRARRQARGCAQEQVPELLLEKGAGDPPQMSGTFTLKNSLLALEEARALAETTFFGVDVNEIPEEKWPEIAPLFPR